MFSKINKLLYGLILGCFTQYALAVIIYQSVDSNGTISYSTTPTKNCKKIIINEQPPLSKGEEKVKTFIGNNPNLEQQNLANQEKYKTLQENFITAFTTYQGTIAKMADPANAKQLPVLTKQLNQQKIALQNAQTQLDEFKAILVKPKT